MGGSETGPPDRPYARVEIPLPAEPVGEVLVEQFELQHGIPVHVHVWYPLVTGEHGWVDVPADEQDDDVLSDAISWAGLVQDSISQGYRLAVRFG